MMGISFLYKSGINFLLNDNLNFILVNFLKEFSQIEYFNTLSV